MEVNGPPALTTADSDSIDIMTPIATYSTRVPHFFTWFWEQIEGSERPDILEYRCNQGSRATTPRWKSHFSEVTRRRPPSEVRAV
jgi:hypothetical protein